jgi:glyoxylate/hydroxypyruvate reductase A
MGLGNIGKAIGDSLINLDFKVVGWGARPKESLGGIEYYCGHEQLADFLSQTDVLINVLPLTEDTKNILTKIELAFLPKGSFIINIGRGGIINESDLLTSLDSGHITAVALDVFAQEPLPENNSLWDHPSVYVTPHIAGQSNPGSAAQTIADNIRLIEKGETPYPIYSHSSGY